MKKIRIYPIVFTLFILAVITQAFMTQNVEQTPENYQVKPVYIENDEELCLSSQKTNYEIINEIFTEKLIQYNNLGYFSQIYESSLQATYFALYILDAINRLDQINQTTIINYILSHYDENMHIFMDTYAYRYLEENPLFGYLPLTTVLEVNCYALLSLDILGKLNLINSFESINFIWSCYNPITSGFIGQSFNINLEPHFKIATMDNTFFAIKTLNLLMNDWTGYSQEISDLIQYINSLQITENINWKFGGFNNDLNNSFDSLALLFEPNLLSSYYCIKSLEILELEDSINQNIFNQFLGALYDPLHFFRASLNSFHHEIANLVATAIGLDLSSITGFSTINRNEVINFIYNNRNQMGIWDQSTTVNIHELIDTFQIIRSLKESGELSQLPSQEKDQIAGSIALYHHYDGYSLLSEDYMSMNLLYTIVESFNSFNRVSDLDILGLYNQITSCFSDHDEDNIGTFAGSTNLDENFKGFRSFPVENTGLGNFFFSHKNTFMALKSLQKIYKLDDFALECDLVGMIDYIINSQFLESGFDGYGAFLPRPSGLPAISQSKKIFFEISYYAIRTLELLVDYLDLGEIVDLSFNKAALYSYITRHMHIFDGMVYFNPHGATDSEVILQQNYYMIYILKALDLLDLDKNNITELVLQKIDYSNIKNIYYCYKINEILDLGMIFNGTLTSELVGQLYSEDIHEFYSNLDYKMKDQEIFLWVCDMARNGDVYIECDYKESVKLGSVNTITASFSNLIFPEYGQLTKVKFEGDQFGKLDLEKLFDNSYQINFKVPEEPLFYPNIEGTLKIYDYSKLIGEYPISFQTSLEEYYNHDIISKKGSTTFLINFSRKFSSEFQAVSNSNIIAEILVDGIYLEIVNFTREDYSKYSKFELNYENKLEGNHSFKIYLFDGFYPNGFYLFEHDEQTNLIDSEGLESANVEGWMLVSVGVPLNILLIGGIYVGGRRIKIKIRNERRKDKSRESKAIEKKTNERSDYNFLDKPIYRDWD
ncbi:MAG: prenyltransferase/squalene oxidase repeat-containing protein [Promethearchaeota archaeon]|jgi:hypothetical protein